SRSTSSCVPIETSARPSIHRMTPRVARIPLSPPRLFQKPKGAVRCLADDPSIRKFPHLKDARARRQTVQIRISVKPEFFLLVHKKVTGLFGEETPFGSDPLPAGICEAEEPVGRSRPDGSLAVQCESIYGRRCQPFSLPITVAAS